MPDGLPERGILRMEIERVQRADRRRATRAQGQTLCRPSYCNGAPQREQTSA